MMRRRIIGWAIRGIGTAVNVIWRDRCASVVRRDRQGSVAVSHLQNWNRHPMAASR